MGETATAITAAQIKCIYALARKGGIDNDSLHALVASVVYKDSIRALSVQEGIQVINRLKILAGQETTGAYDRATKEQVAKIYALAGKLGWMDSPKRLRAWLEKRYGVSHPRFLNERSTRNCIEAMKAMLKGGRAERKGGHDGKVDG